VKSRLAAERGDGRGPEKPRMMPRTAIVQIAQLDSGTWPSEAAVAAGPLLAEAGATAEIVTAGKMVWGR
jgi:hypothetical protein